MFLKSLGAKILAKKATKSIKRWASKPIETQQKVFQKLITQAKNTSFGKDHDFQSIKHIKILLNVLQQGITRA